MNRRQAMLRMALVSLMLGGAASGQVPQTAKVAPSQGDVPVPVPAPPTLVPSTPSEPSLADELDAAAGQPALRPGPAASTPPAASFLGRSFQSLNPDISAIIDATGGYSQRAPLRLAGDDPDLGGGPQQRAAGFTAQEVELGVQAIVDPFLRADLFLTIPNLSGLEVEEGVVTTTSLPADLQIKMGVFRSAMGRQNGQHLHLQDFTRRPLVNAAYLGTDGLRPPGVQVSWLLPTPFFLQLVGEAFSVKPPDDLTAFSTFGGGARTDLTCTSELKGFFPLAESLSAFAGLNVATGLSPGYGSSVGTGGRAYENARSWLYAADLYVKYKPPNQSSGYFSLAWQTEYFFRSVAGVPASGLGGASDGGIYTQVVVQAARNWFVGAREDVLGLPESVLQPRTTRTSASVTFAPSEFARIRAYVERETASASITRALGLSPAVNLGAYLQLEIAMGAHGAHPF